MRLCNVILKSSVHVRTLCAVFLLCCETHRSWLRQTWPSMQQGGILSKKICREIYACIYSALYCRKMNWNKCKKIMKNILLQKYQIMKKKCVVICFINNKRRSLLLFYLCVTRWRSLISALSNQIWGQDRSMARWRTPIKPPWTCPTCLQKRLGLIMSKELSVNEAEN